MSIIKQVVPIILFGFLTACSSTAEVTKSTDSDWGGVAQKDVNNGFPERSQEALLKLSKQTEISVEDYQAYKSAYQEALVEYCEIENAFKLGIANKPYTNACEKFEHGAEFKRRWDAGRRAFTG